MHKYDYNIMGYSVYKLVINYTFFFQVCSDVDRWPPPIPGKILHLPIMGIIMKVNTPALIFL